MNALEILPHYRRVAESLLVQDLHGSDREKSYRAQRWLADLKADVPGNANGQPSPRRRSTPSLSSAPGGIPPDNPTEPSVQTPHAAASPASPAAASSAPARPLPAAPAAPAAAAVPPYNGAKAGTLECNGGPVPQNAEYVFRNVPLVKMQLDYDTKIWDARLVPGEGQTQKLILRNKASGPQKHCVVRWSVIP
jgi:hypothetical protein